MKTMYLEVTLEIFFTLEHLLFVPYLAPQRAFAAHNNINKLQREIRTGN